MLKIYEQRGACTQHAHNIHNIIYNLPAAYII